MLRKHSRVRGLCCALFTVALLSGCSLFYKPLRIDEAHYPFGVLRQTAMSTLPIGLRSSSANGRELLSQYFVVTPKGYQAAIKQSKRYTATILIKNERRPYQVDIYVYEEERVTSGGRTEYRVRGQDLRIATRIKKELEARLAQRREDLNIIDDFRVF
jgi:hypothetical protein